jgi:hypothetical protein
MKNEILKLEEFIESRLTEGSDISPERMLMSIYDFLKTHKNIKLEKIDKKNLIFRFVVSDFLKGSIEGRAGKILISFDEVKLPPKQYDIIYDGDVVLNKDHIREKVFKIIRGYDFNISNLKQI